MFKAYGKKWKNLDFTEFKDLSTIERTLTM